MSNPMDKIKSHYKTKFSQDLLGPIDVPEWEMKIWHRTTMTMNQQSQILKFHQDGKLSEATVMLLIMRALDEEGKPIFKKMDMTELMRGADSEVIGRVVGELTAHDDDDQEALGN